MEILRDLITRHEGDSLRQYRCPAGHWTIGRGWNLNNWRLPGDIAAYERLNGCITQGMSDRLLTIMIDVATDDCREIYPGFDGFSERRRFALIDFLYNVGSSTALAFRRMRGAIIAGDWERAAAEMQDSDWFGQVGTRGHELVAMVREG